MQLNMQEEQGNYSFDICICEYTNNMLWQEII